MAQVKLLVITFLVAGFFVAGECSQELKDFVALKMANYSTWLKDHNLDPSEIDPSAHRFTINNTYAKMDWEFRNHQVSGYSDRHEIGVITAYLSEKEKDFDVKWTCGAVSFSGDYWANGTVGNLNLPISGAGRWHINAPFVRHTNFLISFNETESGNLGITWLNMEGIYFNFEREGIHFENLFDDEAAGEWEAYVKHQMFLNLETYLNGEPESPYHPLRASYVEYWAEVLSQTTMADIVGPGNNTQAFI